MLKFAQHLLVVCTVVYKNCQVTFHEFNFLLVVEPLSDMSPSLDEPAIDDIFEDDNFDSLEDPLQLEPTAQTSRSVNESSLNPIQLKVKF